MPTLLARRPTHLWDMQNPSTGQRSSCVLVPVNGSRYDVLVTSPPQEVLTCETFGTLGKALAFAAHFAVELAHTGWTYQENQNGATFAFELH